MDFTIDPAQIIVALTGVLALLLARGQKKKSEDRQDRIQTARTELDRREAQRVEALDAQAALGEFVKTLQSQHDADQAEKTRVRAECDDRIRDLEDQHERELDRERSAREAEHRVCAREVRHMHEELMTAASLIRSEADAAGVRDAAHRGETHLRFDHDEGGGE